jgi:hypothetical protein
MSPANKAFENNSMTIPEKMAKSFKCKGWFTTKNYLQ